MAEDKKPKIDLKARLGKTAPPTNAPTPAPAPAAVTPSGRPLPMPAPQDAAGGFVPTPGLAGLPGVPVAAGGFNPLAAAAAPQYAPRPAAPPEPQRIEFDDMTVQQASRSARRQGVMIGTVFAVLLGGAGYGVGQVQQQSTDRVKAREGAVDLAKGAAKAKDQLKALADKMEAGKKQLMVDRKFPDGLARELGAINVDFDGKQLEGRRFSGFTSETTRDLVGFITEVQGVNSRKAVILSLLTTLQKPITEQLAIPEGQIKLSHVVAIRKDPSGNVAGFLSRLADPIAVPGSSITLPPKFTFVSPGGGGNSDSPPYTGGDLATKPGVVYIVPKTFDSVCPSATGGQIAQLGAQIGNFLGELKGDAQGADPNMVSDSKPGLIDRADKLIKELQAVGG